MKRFSSDEDRQYVFDPFEEKERAPKIQEGAWIDLYELLEIAPDATAFEIDEAIIARGADTVFFVLAGNGKPPHILQLETYLPDMRPILLDFATRKRYDEQLARHQNHDPHAQTYAGFVATLDRREYSGCIAVLLPVAIFVGAKVLPLLAS